MKALAIVLVAACGGSSAKGASDPGPPPRLPDVTVALELPATLPPGNIAAAPDGKLYVSLHQFYEPKDRVVQLDASEPVPLGDKVPRPIAAGVDSVLGIRGDDRGLVWMLDNGMRGKTTRKLVSWDPKTEKVERTIDLTSVTYADSFLNDLAVDRAHEAIYIADPAGGKNAALVVVDLKTNTAKRVLEGDISVIPGTLDLVIDGKKIDAHIGVNPIALGPGDEWLYFGPMHGPMLYRVQTEALRTGTPKPEPYAKRPITDGISIDSANNIYLGDLANSAIGYIDPDRTYHEIRRNAALSWVDAFSYGVDGYYYVVTNQLHLSAPLNGGNNASKPPFQIWKFKPLAPGRIGR